MGLRVGDWVGLLLIGATGCGVLGPQTLITEQPDIFPNSALQHSVRKERTGLLHILVSNRQKRDHSEHLP